MHCADVTAKLLERKSTLVDKADVSKRTALHILALVPLVLVPVIKPFRSWLRSSRKANIEKIGKMLLDNNNSLMYRVDDNGHSALHLAAKAGNAPLVKVILGYGSDCTHIEDNGGRIALHLAVENASQVYDKVDPSAVRDIISSLALRRLINCSDRRGQTALDIAIEKTEEDKLLFWGVRTYLTKHGARQKMLGTETREDGSASSTRLKSNWKMEIISVNAVLIATVAFAAAFTLPGDIDSDANPPVPFLLHVSLFKVFLIFDSLAFCLSLGSAVLLVFALIGNQEEDTVLTGYCFRGLWAAMTFIALTFAAAIHLVVARKCKWLAVVVWIMVCYLPFAIRLMSMQGKVHLFTERPAYTVLLIEDSVGAIANALYDACMPRYFLAFVWVYVIVAPWRMLVRMLSWTRKKGLEC